MASPSFTLDYNLFAPNWGCCGRESSTELEQKTKQFFETAFADRFNSLASLNNAKQLFGKATRKDYDNQMDLFYLLALCYIMHYDRQNTILAEGTSEDNAYYETLYSLDCIRKTMLCNKFNIMPLLSIFGFDYLTSSGTELMGVGVDRVETQSTVY